MVVSTNKGRWCACSSWWTESRETAGTRKLGPGISCSPPWHVPASTPVRPSYCDDVFLLEATFWKLFQTCGGCLWLKAFSHSPIENSHRSVNWTSSYDCLEMDQCTLERFMCLRVHGVTHHIHIRQYVDSYQRTISGFDSLLSHFFENRGSKTGHQACLTITQAAFSKVFVTYPSTLYFYLWIECLKL